MNKNTVLLTIGVVVFILIIIGGIIFVNHNQSSNVNSDNQGENTQNSSVIGNSKGILEGNITIGPLCPVKKIPPDSNCQPTEATYKAWQVGIYKSDGAKFSDINPNINGFYKLEIPTGNYIVRLNNPNPQSVGKSNLPSNINIKTGETSILNINIDTGIR